MVVPRRREGVERWGVTADGFGCSRVQQSATGFHGVPQGRPEM